MKRAFYFPETDTLYLVLTDNPVAETRDLGGDFTGDLDAQDALVALTVEHAARKMRGNAVALPDEIAAAVRRPAPAFSLADSNLAFPAPARMEN